MGRHAGQDSIASRQTPIILGLVASRAGRISRHTTSEVAQGAGMGQSSRRAVWLTLTLLWLAGNSASAQNPRANNRADGSPEIRSLFPPGVTVGQTAEWTLTGTGLDKVDRWIVTGSGVDVRAGKEADKLTVTASADALPGFRELRGSGPDGISNLLVFRVDSLPQTVESEPNDTAEHANPISIGAAVAGVLKPQDVDYYRVQGRAGQRIAIDLEARRLGTSIMPVVTVMAAGGTPLAQVRETPGAGEDCRLPFTLPADSAYLIEVRENAFGGGDNAAYRLRLDPAPYATALFPLGGRKGETITVTASGGTLPEPLTQRVTLPDQPGTIVELEPFDAPGGRVIPPGRLIVGDGPEMLEPPAVNGADATPLPLGTTVNGRIEHAGEVDRYSLAVKKGKPVRVRVQAAPLGSWLDSVVAIRDEKGNLLAENDDPGNPNAPRRAGVIFGISEAQADSRLDYEPKADGTVIVEVTDRYGDGGDAYGYRLDANSGQADFAIQILLVNPGVNRRVVAGRQAPVPPGSTGAFNLRPGTRLPVNFLIAPEGFTGQIEVRAEGLPPGVTSTAVKLRITGPTRGQPLGGLIELRADGDAEPAVGDLRLMATGTSATGETITRTATAQVAFPPLASSSPRPAAFGTRAVTRQVAHLPVAIVATLRHGNPSAKLFGPPRPVALAPLAIRPPGPLLQGGRIEVALALLPARPPVESFQLEAEVKGRGFITQTLVSDEETTTDDGSTAAAIVRVLAATDAPVGPHTMTIRVVPKGGKPSAREVEIDVRAPVHVDTSKGSIALAPGGTAMLAISVRREAGYGGPIDVRLEGLPKGVKAAGPLRLAPNEDRLEARLAMDADAPPLAEPAPIRVVAVVRMPRGPVRVDSANRPMVMSPRAEK